jgi:hypothetical protein
MGTAPIETGSFKIGCAESPDFVIADSGSADMGPFPLGADISASQEIWQRHDLEVMLLEARRLGVPMVVGSASDTGTNRGVDQYVRLIGEIAAEHKLASFRLAAIRSEIPLEDLKTRLKDGARLAGLNGRPDADAEVLEQTDRAVAVMGTEPICKALADGADVVICGRSCDAAIFAAPLINAGHSKANAFFAGKALECASFCGEPYMGKESVMGRIEEDAVYVSAMHPDQRCTPASVAGHAMYERINPYRETVPGGYLDMTNCHYEQVDEKTTKVTGQVFVEDEDYKIKIEGSGKVAERRLFIIGIRDPYTIANVDQAIDWAKARLNERCGPIGVDYDVFYHVYGRNAVMGDLDPGPVHSPHELGIVVEVTCKDGNRAEEICHMAGFNLFYARLPNVKGTAGTAAMLADEVLTARAAYLWTLNHTMRVDNPLEFTATEFHTIQG